MAKKNPKKVLVVDDDPLILRILKDKLSEVGYLVHTTSSAFGATQLVDEHRPEVVVIDVMLPAIPGPRIAELVRERMKKVKVILYSSKDDAELKQIAKECDADAWLKKSDKYDTLLAEVKRLAR